MNSEYACCFDEATRQVNSKWRNEQYLDSLQCKYSDLRPCQMSLG